MSASIDLHYAAHYLAEAAIEAARAEALPRNEYLSAYSLDAAREAIARARKLIDSAEEALKDKEAA